MQTPVQLELDGITLTPDARAGIDEHVVQLERRFGRITMCRVTVRGPGLHHSNGAAKEIRVRVVLPGGREVNVTRTPDVDERHADLAFAVNDAFKRARRQLQDQAHLLHGAVKHHESGSQI